MALGWILECQILPSTSLQHCYDAYLGISLRPLTLDWILLHLNYTLICGTAIEIISNVCGFSHKKEN